MMSDARQGVTGERGFLEEAEFSESLKDREEQKWEKSRQKKELEEGVGLCLC